MDIQMVSEVSGFLVTWFPFIWFWPEIKETFRSPAPHATS
jgi:hypothetical protein